ncbi:MAG: hypothetical protein M5R36_01615 [Deltaproteobacteria bacterium]|nr:hypothetical protein [Deltaproteobacteria bacterium]
MALQPEARVVVPENAGPHGFAVERPIGRQHILTESFPNLLKRVAALLDDRT